MRIGLSCSVIMVMQVRRVSLYKWAYGISLATAGPQGKRSLRLSPGILSPLSTSNPSISIEYFRPCRRSFLGGPVRVDMCDVFLMWQMMTRFTSVSTETVTTLRIVSALDLPQDPSAPLPTELAL